MANKSAANPTRQLNKAAEEKSDIVVPEGYIPTNDDKEFMNPVMLVFFENLLLGIKEQVVRQKRDATEEGKSTIRSMGVHADYTDRASVEVNAAADTQSVRVLDLRLRAVNAALTRIRDAREGIIVRDWYGYCIDTGDVIPLERLLSNPTAKRTIEAQERHERKKSAYGGQLPPLGPGR